MIQKVNAGLAILEEMIDRLPGSERKIAEYILKFPKESINLTVVELGKVSGTSSAAVIRLCKSLQVNSFQDLKLRIAGDLQNERQDLRDIEPNESFETMVEKITLQSIRSLRETTNMIDMVQLTKAVEVILEASHIYIFGVGASGIAAMDVQQKFMRINKYCSYYPDVHLAATAVANASKKDVIFGISSSGNTHEVAKILEIGMQAGAKTISLTRYGNSLVADLAEINLFTATSLEPTFRSGATSSRLAQLHVIDMLFMCIATTTFEQTIGYLDTTRMAIDTLHQKLPKRKTANEQELSE